MSSDLETLRVLVYKDYEFWLGCFQTDKSEWISGLIHAYRNTLEQVDKQSGRIPDNAVKFCPCHVCVRMRNIKQQEE